MTPHLIKPEDRILIAGASGMAGGAISRALDLAGYKNQLTPSHNDLDLSDIALVSAWFNKYQPEIVVIAAAKVGGIHANSTEPVDFLLENLKIQNNLIESSWKFGIRRLLFLGSSCIYPKFAKQPISEESLLTGPLEPTNEFYAVAKIAGIKLCEALRKQHNFNAISLMPTNLYGPGDNYHLTGSHVLPALIRRFHEAKINNAPSVTCWGTGKPLREFLHADDLGNACVFALEKWDPSSSSSPNDNSGEPLTFLNVGTGLDLSIKELANKVANTVGYSGQILWDLSKPDGTPKKQLDISNLSKIGWQAKISLNDGLRMAYEDFLLSTSRGDLRK